MVLQFRPMSQQTRIWLMLTPALLVVVLLFGGGLLLGFLQSFGIRPVVGDAKFTFAAYRAIFSEAAFGRSLLLTFWIGFASTAISTVLAIACALVLRDQFRGKRWVTFLFQLNIPIPHLVGAIGILLLFSQSGFFARIGVALGLMTDPMEFPVLVRDPYGIGIILQYVWKTTCFTGIIVLATLQSIGADFENVAATLGANRWQRFRFITLPLIMPGVLSASILVFAFTFGAFDVPFILGQRFPSALPVLAYRRYVAVDLTQRPEAMAMSMIIALLITLLIFVYRRVGGGIRR